MFTKEVIAFVTYSIVVVVNVAYNLLASFPGRKNERPGTHCMRMRSIPQNLENPVISVNYCSFSRLENETSLDARLPSILTNVKIEGGRGYRPGSKPLCATQRQQTFMAFV